MQSVSQSGHHRC